MGRTVGLIFGCVACLLVGLAIGYNLSQGNARQTAIKWKYGNAELVIDLDQDMVDDETLFSKIFSQNFARAGAVDWLKNPRKNLPLPRLGYGARAGGFALRCPHV